MGQFKKFCFMKKAGATTIIIALISGGITTRASDPGSSDDPLVSVSYVQSKIVAPLKTFATEAASEAKFKVIKINPGEKFFGFDGCEFLLRSGAASVIASAAGGICDATAGADLLTGMPISKNHLMIIAVGDGRGFRATTPVIALVKGGHEIRR